MALFRKIFGKGNEIPCSLQPEEIAVDRLKQLIPIRNLSEEELTGYALAEKSEVFGATTKLFSLGEPVDFVLYLLEGTVSMEPEGEKPYTVCSEMPKARFPLSSGKLHGSTATAKTDIRVLRVSNKILSETRSLNDSLVQDLAQLEDSEQLQDSRLFQTFCQNYRDDELIIPTLPDVATKFRQASQEDIGIAEAVKIIQLDSAISAKLVRVANSPLYLTVNPVTNCFDAVKRLGISATRNLVLSFFLNQVFQSNNPILVKLFTKHWKQSVQISCLCYVLAAENQPSVNPEEALLAGLICDIGIIPFLQFAENFPKDYYDPKELEIAIPLIRGPVGALILNKWGFPDDFAAIPTLAEDWYHDSGDQLTLADIVILSKLHSHMGTPKMTDLPAINSIPACGKLKDGALSPEYSLSVLHNAKDKIQAALRLFET